MQKLALIFGIVSLALSGFSLGYCLCNFKVQKMNELVQKIHAVNQILIKNYEEEKNLRENLEHLLTCGKDDSNNNGN